MKKLLVRRPRVLSARLVGFFVIAGASAFFLLASFDRSDEQRRVTEISTSTGDRMSLELAATPATRSRGLSGRDRVSHHGLILVWPTAGRHPVWMSEMRFPLDLIWCNAAGLVTAIKPAVPICTTDAPCPLYGATLDDTQAVIELPAGTMQRVGIRRGDQLSIPALSGMRQTH